MRGAGHLIRRFSAPSSVRWWIRGKGAVAQAMSNAGQVLWSCIAHDDHAHAVAARLLGQDLFGGWGVRTLSSEATAYNPIGYHLGTVWPHDDGLIAEGLRRYGRDVGGRRSPGSGSGRVGTGLNHCSLDGIRPSAAFGPHVPRR
jgi:hypothetical protein